jgi:hypothetical protein
MLYKYSILLSVPLALLAGAFAVVLPEAYKKTRKIRSNSPEKNDFVSLKS